MMVLGGQTTRLETHDGLIPSGVRGSGALLVTLCIPLMPLQISFMSVSTMAAWQQELIKPGPRLCDGFSCKHMFLVDVLVADSERVEMHAYAQGVYPTIKSLQ